MAGFGGDVGEEAGEEGSVDGVFKGGGFGWFFGAVGVCGGSTSTRVFAALRLGVGGGKGS